jgi:putative SOS response-associated peptidase YedK
MCGRFTQMMKWRELHELYSMPRLPLGDELSPNFNGAPTQRFGIVLWDADAGERVGRQMQWGLVPFWAKDVRIGSKMINARSESAPVKPSFRTAFKRRRCIVPASGFYEWEEVPGAKKGQPNYIHRSDGLPLSFAGLWEQWGPKDEPPLETFTILTTDANTFMGVIHHRMPVVLDKAGWEQWLDPEADPEALVPLLRLREWAGVERYAVSPVVNSVKNNSPECIAHL